VTARRHEYTYGGDFAEERTRLASIESLWDPGSQALLDELGVHSGSRCLEVGPGGGSLVEWMARRGATVTAIDIDTRFIDHLRSDSIVVRCADIRHDALPQSEFDLVHARLVLEHLDDRREILDRLITTLRPGGWILIEDYDWTTFEFEGGDDDGFIHAAKACMEFMNRAGYERDYGRRVVGEMAEAGLTEVRGEGRVRIIDSNSPGLDFFRLSFESLREAVIAAGLITAKDADAASARFKRDFRLTTPMMVAGLGRRP
jgi:SAM-dependent methyltransferase